MRNCTKGIRVRHGIVGNSAVVARVRVQSSPHEAPHHEGREASSTQRFSMARECRAACDNKREQKKKKNEIDVNCEKRHDMDCIDSRKLPGKSDS